MLSTAALLGILAKVTILLSLALGFAFLARRASAAARHLICLLALAGSLAVPLLWAVMPGLDLAVLPPAELPASFAAATPVAPPAGFPLAGVLGGAWIAGVCALLARLVLGVRGVRALCREATEIRDARTLTAALEARQALGRRLPIRVALTGRVSVPVSWGLVRSTILLPADSLGWSRPKLRAVLLHEMSHLSRRDCLTQLVADFSSAVFWFHPFAWLAAHRMRVERENACDDRVLIRGARPSKYAALLLSTFRLPPFRGIVLAPVTAFAHRSELESRVRAVLSPVRSRRALSRGSRGLLIAAAAAVILPLAAMTFVSKGSSGEPAPLVVETPVVSGEPAPPGDAETVKTCFRFAAARMSECEWAFDDGGQGHVRIKGEVIDELAGSGWTRLVYGRAVIERAD